VALCASAGAVELSLRVWVPPTQGVVDWTVTGTTADGDTVLNLTVVPVPARVADGGVCATAVVKGLHYGTARVDATLQALGSPLVASWTVTIFAPLCVEPRDQVQVREHKPLHREMCMSRVRYVRAEGDTATLPASRLRRGSSSQRHHNNAPTATLFTTLDGRERHVHPPGRVGTPADPSSPPKGRLAVVSACVESLVEEVD
jgi:hypothetical protein